VCVFGETGVDEVAVYSRPPVDSLSTLINSNNPRQTLVIFYIQNISPVHSIPQPHLELESCFKLHTTLTSLLVLRYQHFRYHHQSVREFDDNSLLNSYPPHPSRLLLPTRRQLSILSVWFSGRLLILDPRNLCCRGISLAVVSVEDVFSTE
jgi:hypothetical protein